jgi:hypothetical protein
MNVYVMTAGKVLSFQQGEDFEFSVIADGKGLVEVKAFAEGDYGKRPEERRYAPAGRVIIGEGSAVILGRTVPVPLKMPSLRRAKGVYIGSGESWYVLQPITRHENSGDLLKVFAEIQREHGSEEQMVGLFWLKVGDVFGRENDSDGPTQSAVPGPIDPP